MKYACHAIKILAFTFFTFLVLSTISCKKEGDSPDSFNYSLNGGPARNCPGKSIGVEALGPNCRTTFGRSGHVMFNEVAQIEFLSDSDCNLVSGPLPYSTSKFQFVVIDNNDIAMPGHQLSYYAYNSGRSYQSTLDPAPPYDSLANTYGGNLVLQITYRNNGRIKGSIKGDICSTDVHDLASQKINCDFDLLIPFH